MLKFKFYLLAVVIFLTTNSFAQLAGNYTINSAAATSGTNFQSFSDLTAELDLNGISGAVIVDVVAGSGPYNEQVIFENYSGASSINRLTINGNGETVVYAPSTTDYRIIGFDSAKYITLNKLTIVGDDVQYGYGIHLKNKSDHVIIENCSIDLSKIFRYNFSGGYTHSAGIIASSFIVNSPQTLSNASSNLIIRNNEIIGASTGSASVGVYLTSGSTPDSLNSVENNTIKDFYGAGIQLNNQINCLVEGNDLSSPNRNNTSSFPSCISLFGNLTNTKVSRNRIHNLSDQLNNSNDIQQIIGIYVSQADATISEPIEISNNLFYNLSSNRASVSAIEVFLSEDIRIIHNSIDLKATQLNSQRYTKGFDFRNLVNDVVLSNNTVSISGSTSQPKYGISIDNQNSTITDENNNFYVNAGSSNNYYGQFNSTSYTTLASWQAVANQIFGLNCLTADPQYLEATSGDLSFQNPTLKNAGIASSITTDFYNRPHDTVPDIGAVKDACFGITDLVHAADSSSATIDWNSISGNYWEIELDTVKFNPGGGANRYKVSSSTDTTFLNLKLGTQYFYSIRSFCANGDSSYWSILNNFYVSDGLSGVYNLNSAAPTGLRNFQSFTDLANRLNKDGILSSVTINVVNGSGPYNEKFVLNSVRGTSSSKRIVINGSNEVISAPPSITDYRIIGLNNTQYVTIDSLNIVSQDDENCFAVHLMNFADHNVISNCVINMSSVKTSDLSAGVICNETYNWLQPSNSTVSNLLVEGCTIFGDSTAMMSGIWLEGNSSTSYPTNNVIRNNLIKNFGYNGIWAKKQKDLTLEKNKITRPDSLGYNDFNGSRINGILINGRCDNLEIRQNELTQIYNMPTTFLGRITGILTNSGSGAINPRVVNNIFSDFVCNGSVTVFSTNTYDSTQYYHNTINFKNPLNLPIDITGLGYAGAIGIEFKNNILAIDGADSATIFAIMGGSIGSTNSIDYNNYYLTSTSSTAQNFSKINTTFYPTLSAWQATGRDQNSWILNPFFASDKNLLPLNLNLLGAGTNLNVNEDFYGRRRNAPPDIGAIAINYSTTANLPFYPVSIINTEDTSGLIDSIFVKCATSGTVISQNLSNNGLSFYVTESGSGRQEGIKVYSDQPVSQYTPQVGDSLLLRGLVFQDKGLPSFFVDSIQVLKSAAFIPNPISINHPNDSAQNKLIELSDLEIIIALDSLTNWIVATNGLDTIRTYISEGNSLKDSLLKYPLSIGDSICMLTAIGSQNDTVQPYIDNYIIEALSFDLLDIENCQCFPSLRESAFSLYQTVQFSWDSYPTADRHILTYDSAGFNLGQSINPPIVVSQNDTTLTNLNKGWSYDYFIGTICKNEDTLWSNRKSFYVKNTLSFGNYTIDSSRVTANNNFQSFTDFKSRIESEGISGAITVDVVNGSGPYNQNFILNKIDGMSASNSITINGNGEIIEFNPTANDKRIISLNGVKHLTIDSLTVIGLSNQYGFGIQLTNEADSNIIRNCRIDLGNVISTSNTFENSAGIVINNSINRVSSAGKASYNQILNNEIIGSATNGMMYGIYIHGTPNYNLSNKIIGNTIIDFYSDGITITDQANLLVSKNEISKPNLNSAGDVFGFYITGTQNDNLKIEKNRISDITNLNNSAAKIHGIYFNRVDGSSTNTHKIENNIISSIQSVGSLYGIYNNVSNHLAIQHNTVFLADTNLLGGKIYGYWQQSGSNNIELKNNLIAITKNGSTESIYGVYLSNSASSNQYDFNSIYLKSTVGNTYYGFYNGNQTNLSDWQAGSTSNYGSNSLQANPLFAKNDLIPRNMLLKNAAEPSNVFTDFSDKQRSATPDIGAFELDTLFLSQLPFRAIHTINKENSNGEADSLGTEFQTTGIVISDFFKEAEGRSFYIKELYGSNHEGLNIYLHADSSIYEPRIGDSVKIYGVLEQKNGLTRMQFFDVRHLSSSNAIASQSVTSFLDESTESILVKYMGLKVTQVSQGQLELLTSNNDTVLVELNQLTNLHDSILNNPISVGDSVCSVIGIGSQNDSLITYFDNYLLRPRFYSDFDFLSCKLATSLQINHKNAINSLIIYPNPTSGDIWIKDASFSGNYEIRIYNSLGKLIQNTLVSSANYLLNLNAAEGIYILEVVKNNKREHYRIIKNSYN